MVESELDFDARLLEVTMAVSAIVVSQAFDEITDHWSPRVLGRVNDQYVKAAKLKGEFVWHKHEHEDELFHVVRGRLLIQFEGHELALREGEMCVVPRGIMHKPVAEEECWVLLVETVTTKHTGDVVIPLTKSIDDQLSHYQPVS
jgi:mannose-6-phosphate isomerase-like protein (cupin superfamily)